MLNDTQIGRVKNLDSVIGDATKKKLEKISEFVNIGNIERKKTSTFSLIHSIAKTSETALVRQAILKDNLLLEGSFDDVFMTFKSAKCDPWEKASLLKFKSSELDCGHHQETSEWASLISNSLSE